MHFRNIFFKIDNFTFIVVTIVAPVFDLGVSFGEVKFWKESGKILNIYIQTCVGTLNVATDFATSIVHFCE